MLAECIERFYNVSRLHSSLGYCSRSNSSNQMFAYSVHKIE